MQRYDPAGLLSDPAGLWHGGLPPVLNPQLSTNLAASITGGAVQKQIPVRPKVSIVRTDICTFVASSLLHATIPLKVVKTGDGIEFR
jgi:hypothetical protein